MVLSNAAGATLLILDRTTTTLPLVDVAWQLEALQQDGQWQPVLPDSQISAEFSWLDYGADGSKQLTGSAGCNSYSAAYTFSGEQLTIVPLAITRMSCNYFPGLMAQEAAYLATLDAVVSYRLQDNPLELLDDTGEAIARVRRPLGE